jgi:hypothetical protein
MAWLIRSPLPAIIALLVFTSGVPSSVDLEATSSDHPMVAWAAERFAAAGLVLPDVTFEFFEDTTACRLRRGLYFPDSRVVKVCTEDRDVVIHELAHAWAEANLTIADKEAFTSRRHLPTWDSHDFDWEQRGTEHAAMIIAWALADESQLVRWVDERGDLGFRLLNIPDSDPGQLVAEFGRLTGREPILRHPSEWTVDQTQSESFSPESARGSTRASGAVSGDGNG